MNAANKGVILFSLGTVANITQMPMEWKEHFLDAFLRFTDYIIIWKVNNKDDVPKRTYNYNHIHVSEWVPQRSLLSKKNAGVVELKIM